MKQLPNITTETVMNAVMRTLICRHGIPEIMVSDQGVQFVSSIAQALFKSLKIRRITTTAYHPQANMVERYNKTLKQVLKLWVDENQSDWDDLLPFARFAYNTEYHSLIKETPHYVIHARDARTFINSITRNNDHQNTSVHEYVNVINERMHVVHERIRLIYNKVNEQRESELLQSNKLVQYKVGDKVYLYNPTTAVGLTKKFVRRWDGPYVITRVKSAVDYEILKDDKTKVVHINRIKLVNEFSDDNNDLDVYNQVLKITELELERLEKSIEALVYEKENKIRELNSHLQNFKAAGDSLVDNNIDNNDDVEGDIYDYKSKFISIHHLQQHKLKWKPKQQSSVSNSNSNETIISPVIEKQPVLPQSSINSSKDIVDKSSSNNTSYNSLSKEEKSSIDVGRTVSASTTNKHNAVIVNVSTLLFLR